MSLGLEVSPKPQVPHENVQRRGVFGVSSELLDSAKWAQLTKVFSGVVVLKTRQGEPGQVEYLAYSEHFDVLDPADPAPRYLITIHAEDGGETVSKVTWGRCP